MSVVAANGAGFMIQATITTFSIVGAVVANLGLLKGINSVSSIGLSTISYIQGLGVDSNESKESVADDDRVGRKLTDRAWTAIKKDIFDIPKIALVIALGLLCMGLASKLGAGQSITNFIFSLVPGAKLA